MSARTTLFVFVLPAVMASGCSGDGSSGGSGSSSSPLPCQQKAGADGDEDCATAPGSRTRKLDCDTIVERDQALAAGCVSQDPTDADDTDVCCPPTVFGTPDGSSGGSSSGGSSTGGSVTGSGGSSTGGSTSGTGGSGGDGVHTVECDQTRDKGPFASAVGATICSCTADTDTGAAMYEGEICGQGDTELFCCADPEYPTSGACDCRLTRPWTCMQLNTTSGGNVTKCSCAFVVQEPALPTVTTCDLSTPYTQICCRRNELPVGCECRNTTACSSDETQVTDCSTPGAAGLLPAPTQCPDGQASVSTCSEGLTAQMPTPGGSTCDPASCSGSDCANSGGYSFCCFWSCGSSGCEQTCTD